MSAPLHPDLDPALFGDASAREECFELRDRWRDLRALPVGHPGKAVEFLHRQMHEEVQVMENAARDLHEFPDEEWEVRYWLARQVADEARHAIAYRGAVERRGGHVGMHPVWAFQYRVLGRVHSLIGRLAVQNRTFEADGLDAVTHEIGASRARGADDLVEQYEAQQADEVLHVRFANEYIRREVARRPRAVLEMTRALSLAARAFAQATEGGGRSNIPHGVASEERSLAGFTPDEIATAVRLAETRRREESQAPAGVVPRDGDPLPRDRRAAERATMDTP